MIGLSWKSGTGLLVLGEDLTGHVGGGGYIRRGTEGESYLMGPVPGFIFTW